VRLREGRSSANLYRNHAGLAFDITWIAAREEQMLDENLLSASAGARRWSAPPI
jgi:hypothetical protein